MAKHIKDKDKADLISKKIGDQFQELSKSLQGITYEKMFTNSKESVSLWKQKQYSAMNGLKKEIATITQTEGKKLVKEIKNASSELELTPKQTKGLINQVTGGLNYLNRAVIQGYQKDISQISSNVKTIKSEASDILYKEIQKQIYKSNRIGVIYSVPTNDGNYKYRNWKWENYREMKTRTDIQHEITENMIAAGDESGVVFYICSFFGDCAKDHVDYQGKIYHADGWQAFAPKDRIDEIEAYIKAHGIMSVKQVTENDPWLTTRPNCRHYFQYISIDEVLGIKNNKDLNNKRNEMNLNFNGKYQPKKYEALQEQRANERAIRETKSQIDILKMSIDNAPATIDKKELFSMNAQLTNLNYQLKKRQLAQRELIKKYDNLERRYDREKPGAVVANIGNEERDRPKVDIPNPDEEMIRLAKEIQSKDYEEFKQAIADKKIVVDKIDVGKQNKHIPGTNDYKTATRNGIGKSILIADPNKLLKRLDDAIIKKMNDGQFYGYLKFEKPIGRYINTNKNVDEPTKIAAIRFSNGGVHFISINPRKDLKKWLKL